MAKAPKSYLDARRPPLDEALRLEGEGLTITEASDSLEKKGYFTAKARPWKIGIAHRGLGRNSYAVLDRFGDLIAEMPDHETADLVVEAVNHFSEQVLKAKVHFSKKYSQGTILTDPKGRNWKVIRVLNPEPDGTPRYLLGEVGSRLRFTHSHRKVSNWKMKS